MRINQTMNIDETIEADFDQFFPHLNCESQVDRNYTTTTYTVSNSSLPFEVTGSPINDYKRRKPTGDYNSHRDRNNIAVKKSRLNAKKRKESKLNELQELKEKIPLWEEGVSKITEQHKNIQQIIANQAGLPREVVQEKLLKEASFWIKRK